LLAVSDIQIELLSHLLIYSATLDTQSVAIEFDIDPNEFEVVDIHYRGVFATVDCEADAEPKVVAQAVLSSKYDVWKYEKEIRILTTDTFYKLKNPIARVIVGHRMSKPFI
jgi:hypothetical protein